jgi:hypothetical protein
MVYEDKIISLIGNNGVNKSFFLIGYLILFAVYCLSLKLYFSRAGHLVKIIFFLWPFVSFFFVRNFFIKKYVVDFCKRKIYFHFCGFLRFPIVTFEQVGGIEKVWGDSDEKSFFYKVWKKGKRYEHGIPLSDIHGVSGTFDADFARSVLPIILESFNNNNIDNSDSLTVSDSVFHVIDEKIYYKRNHHKDCFLVLIGSLGVLFLSSGFIFVTHGIFFLLLLFAFYPAWKYLIKDNFYIIKSNNDILFHLFKDDINCSISEIKSISISTSSTIANLYIDRKSVV